MSYETTTPTGETQTFSLMDGKSYYLNCDCMELLRKLPDKSIGLCVTDPPYGDGGYLEKDGHKQIRRMVRPLQGNRSESAGGGYQTRGKDGKWHPPNWWNMGGEVRKKIIAWDTAPGQEYFDELFRVSRNQIIWGGNYFGLPPTRCFLIWRKTNIPEKFSMAMCEYAWTSFNDNAKMFFMSSAGQKDRFHPSQKPPELYKWILQKYAKEGDIILDTHVGSGSSLIACEELGFKYIGCEIDEDYYRLSSERLERFRQQNGIKELMNDWRLP